MQKIMNADMETTRHAFDEPRIRNPFVHNLKLNFKDKLKIAVGAVFLLPLRFLSAVIIFFVMVSIAAISISGMPNETIMTEPIKGWRSTLCSSLSYLGRAFFFCLGFHRIKINGKQASKDEARIFVVAPHTSLFDTFVFFALGLPCGVSRIENSLLPLFGLGLKAVQPILVSRESSNKRDDVINEIKKRTSDTSPWKQLYIYPEGTCTNRKCLITFKPGAFIPGLPVQPVVIKYGNKLDSITWPSFGINLIEVFFYTLCQFHNHMEITFLPVIVPSHEEKQNPVLYADSVRRTMAAYLRLPTTDHTYEDVRLMAACLPLGLPYDIGLVEYAKLKKHLGINYDYCKTILEKYALVARKSDGTIGLAEFCRYLEFPLSKPVQDLFDSYDTWLDKQNTGLVSLKDIQNNLFHTFSMEPDEVNKIYNTMDTNRDGLVSFDEFKAFIFNKPEYARLFAIFYRDLDKTTNNNVCHGNCMDCDSKNVV